jgi:predicted solute-binding protein
MKAPSLVPKPNKAIIDPKGLPSIKLPDNIRVGSVPYLNAKPLTRFISSPITLVEPSQLATDLRAGKLDVALVPIMEVLESPPNTYRIVDKIAIGSEREVFSVYLNYSVPLAKVKTVALDPASKTSVELARLVLEKFHRLKPRYVTTDEPADAQLLIGDPAITHRQAHPEQNYLDLATAWRENTGLPFVFAVWAVRNSASKAWSLSLTSLVSGSVPDLLRRAGKHGLAWRDAIARNPFERKYLKEHLCYDLGARQKKAITLFGQMLAQSNRIPSEPKVSYI